ncbi:MAG TPA: NERD domain-containing protein [Clostridia bacterium]
MPAWQIILIGFVFVLGLFCLYIRVLSKGEEGEFAVKLVLLLLNKRKYKKFHNVIFKDDDKTIQIDHLIFSKYGIFVIETKNYSGTIYGSENAHYFYKFNHNKKYEFYNPIKQNFGHIFALKNVLGDYKYISAVVFTGYAKLKVESKSFVGYVGELPRYIKSFKEEIYSEEQVLEISEKLKALALKGIFINREHIKSVKQRLQEYDEKIENMICPKCGNQLVIRKGQYGEFLGCSAYPDCQFTQKIKEI